MRGPGFDKGAPRSLRALMLAAGLAVLLAAGCCTASTKTTATTQNAAYEASGLLTPVRQAPPLALRNYMGQPVNIASFMGKAVLVTFLYTHCPDVCPLITSQLHVAQTLMGPATAAKAQIIAVSVDSRGDTPAAVEAFLTRHLMKGHMQYLVGSTPELAKVWNAWGVGSERDASNPELVNHTGLVFGISASGKRITIYAPNFKPAEIAHDVPILAAH